MTCSHGPDWLEDCYQCHTREAVRLAGDDDGRIAMVAQRESAAGADVVIKLHEAGFECKDPPGGADVFFAVHVVVIGARDKVALTLAGFHPSGDGNMARKMEKTLRSCEVRRHLRRHGPITHGRGT